MACEGLTAFKGHPKRSKVHVYFMQDLEIPQRWSGIGLKPPHLSPRGGLTGGQGDAGGAEVGEMSEQRSRRGSSGKIWHSSR